MRNLIWGLAGVDCGVSVGGEMWGMGVRIMECGVERGKSGHKRDKW